MSERALPVWVSGVTAEKAGRIGGHAVVGTAWALLSYALFTGKYIVKHTHPVLGTIFGLFAVGHAATIVVESTEA